MLVCPSDVPWDSLTDAHFEEMLYWLLHEMGAKDLIWRKEVRELPAGRLHRGFRAPHWLGAHIKTGRGGLTGTCYRSSPRPGCTASIPNATWAPSSACSIQARRARRAASGPSWRRSSALSVPRGSAGGPTPCTPRRGRVLGRCLRQRSRDPSRFAIARPLEFVASTRCGQRGLGVGLADLELRPVSAGGARDVQPLADVREEAGRDAVPSRDLRHRFDPDLFVQGLARHHHRPIVPREVERIATLRSRRLFAAGGASLASVETAIRV